MELSFAPNDRGQVGIGTLIVFIAMVLVAAIAAGVLINTAGFLQTQAEDTGTESTDQVANNLNLITTVGTVNDTGSGSGAITDLAIGVQPSSGADDINLERLSLQFVSESEFSNLVHAEGVDVDDNNSIVGERTVFNSVPVTAEDGTDNVMTSGADRYELVIPLEDAAPFANASASDVTSNITDGGDADLDDDQVVVVNESGGAINTASLHSSVDGKDQIVENDTTTLVLEFEDLDETELATYENRDNIEFPNGSTYNNVPSINQSFLNPNTLDEGIGNGLGQLDEGESAEVTITTESGAQAVKILKVPDSLAAQDDGDRVNL